MFTDHISWVGHIILVTDYYYIFTPLHLNGYILNISHRYVTATHGAYRLQWTDSVVDHCHSCLIPICNAFFIRRWPQNKTGVVHRYQATVTIACFPGCFPTSILQMLSHRSKSNFPKFDRPSVSYFWDRVSCISNFFSFTTDVKMFTVAHVLLKRCFLQWSP